MNDANRCCANCRYGRLICSEDNCEEYVGCIQYKDSGEERLLKDLAVHKYISPINDYIMTGWIYVNIPFGMSRSQFDTADAALITNNRLISPKEACCDMFEQKIGI